MGIFVMYSYQPLTDAGPFACAERYKMLGFDNGFIYDEPLRCKIRWLHPIFATCIEFEIIKEYHGSF